MKFRTKTILGVATIEIVLVTSLMFYGMNWLKSTNEDELQTQAHNIVKLLSTATKDAVLAYDLATLDEFTSSLVKQEGIVYVRIYNNDTVLSKGGDAQSLAKPFVEDADVSNIDDHVFDVATDITEAGNIFGRIELGLSNEHIEHTLAEAREKAPFIALTGIAMSGMFSFLLGCYLTRQLGKLKQAAIEISQGNIGHLIPVSGNDELADTAMSFNTMSKRLKSSYDELANSLAKSKQISAALHESELYTNTILNNIADAIVSTDENGVIESVNEAFESVFGYKAYEVIGKNINMLVPLKDAQKLVPYMSNYVNSDRSNTVLNTKHELTARHKDGHSFPIALAVKPVHVNDELIFVGLIEEISEKKNVQQELVDAKIAAEAASRAKSEFLANMSHEIRTPMNGVIGMLELLGSTGVTDIQRKYLKTATSSAELLLNIINDILDFSKIEAGKLSVESISFNIHQVVEDVAELLNQQVNHTQVEICCFVDTEVPDFLYGDPARLSQILMNLGSNAIKFTSNGEISIRITAKQQNEHYKLLFEVSDTGIGIAEEKIKILFQAFQQADGSTSRRFGGTGLGLTICKQLVEIMSGTIGAKSTPGIGSVFWFEIDFKKSEQTSSPSYETIQDKTIIIVDDNNTSLEIMSSYLVREGAQVHQTSGGFESIELANKMIGQGQAIDLIILDMKMPDMDGIETAKRLKAERVTEDIPLTMVSSLGIIENIPADSGIVLSLSKPIRQKQFLNHISLVFGKHCDTEKDNLHQIQLETISFPTARVLLVEDNIVNQEMATEMLKLFGIEPGLATNGLEAVEAFKFGEFDLVLMDCQMPVLDGYDATRQIREFEKSSDLKPTPVIALTANAMQGDRELCEAAGMDDHIAKPVKLSGIENMLRQWLPDKLQQQEKIMSDNNELTGLTEDASQHIDLDTYNDLTNKLGQRMYVIVDKFIDNARILIDDMAAAINNNEISKIEIKAHTLKGSSLSVTANKLSILAQEMEQQAKNNSSYDFGTLHNDIEKEFKSLTRCFEQLCKNKKTA